MSRQASLTRLADIDEEVDETGMLDRLLLLEAPVGDLVEEDVLLRARIDEISRHVPRPDLVAGPVEDPRPEGIQPPDAGQIDDETALVPIRAEFGGEALDLRGMLGRPGSGQLGRDLVAGPLDPGLRLLCQGGLRQCLFSRRVISAWYYRGLSP